jgi:hypothetical protein
LSPVVSAEAGSPELTWFVEAPLVEGDLVILNGYMVASSAEAASISVKQLVVESRSVTRHFYVQELYPTSRSSIPGNCASMDRISSFPLAIPSSSKGPSFTTASCA